VSGVGWNRLLERGDSGVDPTKRVSARLDQSG
jgi:hypothetical protein